MTFIWLRALFLTSLVLVLTFVFWLSGDPLLGLSIAVISFAGLYFQHTYNINRLVHWAKNPLDQKLPEGSGIWAEVFYLINRVLKKIDAETQIERNKYNRFIQAIQASPNGVLMLDEQDQIEWCNAMSASHFGINPKADYLQKIKNLIRQPGFISYLDAGRFEQPLTISNTGALQNQVLSVQVFPYGQNEKLLVSRDITQYERNDAIRREFVANVSHELRTPLTVLAGFLETIREMNITETDRRRYLDLMYQQSTRMQNLVDDLLTLSRLENNYNIVRESWFPLSALLRILVHDAENLSKGQHHISLSIQAEDSMLLGAETEISSAFSNLILNAIRYTPSGGIVEVSWKVDAEGNGFFAVRDTGIGIPKEHIPRLTERFYRVEKSRSTETGGTGLGLAIVKHVLMRHQATLEIQSQEGHGSKFMAKFPASRVGIKNESVLLNS